MSRRSRLDSNFRLIARLYPGVHTVYGPYLSKDGRYRVVLYDGTRRITRQYAKLKMELKLKRRLHEHNETVDHWDNNKKNDRYSNLRLLTRSEHAKQDAMRIEPILGNCKWCDSQFVLSKAQLDRYNDNKAGPFCSFSCRGKASHVDTGKRTKYTVVKKRNKRR